MSLAAQGVVARKLKISGCRFASLVGEGIENKAPLGCNLGTSAGRLHCSNLIAPNSLVLEMKNMEGGAHVGRTCSNQRRTVARGDDDSDSGNIYIFDGATLVAILTHPTPHARRLRMMPYLRGVARRACARAPCLRMQVRAGRCAPPSYERPAAP